ncbi:hypothetical protein AVEN_173076-1 [Araneus ventricosus]|uniref:Uncharacterized protein n=1 Tax=Araneus ventricosus TaxID=182803 RepID=A0A4Y2HE37_ARAVE|nr:hypothetical protein AVEN_173076-1 [Araneus ventricosus]
MDLEKAKHLVRRASVLVLFVRLLIDVFGLDLYGIACVIIITGYIGRKLKVKNIKTHVDFISSLKEMRENFIIREFAEIMNWEDLERNLILEQPNWREYILKNRSKLRLCLLITFVFILRVLLDFTFTGIVATILIIGCISKVLKDRGILNMDINNLYANL